MLAIIDEVIVIDKVIITAHAEIYALIVVWWYFVVGNDIVAAMYRESENWKNNVSQGAKPIPFKPSDELKELAIRASEILGCRISGVDILESAEGKFICEINSQPGFRGLQSVTKINIAEKIIEFITNKYEG